MGHRAHDPSDPPPALPWGWRKVGNPGDPSSLPSPSQPLLEVVPLLIGEGSALGGRPRKRGPLPCSGFAEGPFAGFSLRGQALVAGGGFPTAGRVRGGGGPGQGRSRGASPGILVSFPVGPEVWAGVSPTHLGGAGHWLPPRPRDSVPGSSRQSRLMQPNVTGRGRAMGAGLEGV